MKWHQRLDEEEAEVLQLERQLRNYNNVPQQLVADEQERSHQMPAPRTITPTEKLTPLREDSELLHSTAAKTPQRKRALRARKMEKRLKEIDKSLKELSHISAASATNSAIAMGQNSDEIEISSTCAHEVDYVRTTGSKLNKLWRRLTSQTIEKYEPTRRYKLCKADLEILYEDAKKAVLRDFAKDEERTAQELLEKSPTTFSSSTSPLLHARAASRESASDIEVDGQDKVINVLEIPILNLNFSSGHSEAEEESATNVCKPKAPQGIYSPSVAEQNFKAKLSTASSTSSLDNVDMPAPCSDGNQQQRIESNIQMFLALTQRLKLGVLNNSQQQGLQRSLSDTQIADIPKLTAATSHTHSSAAAASQLITTMGSQDGPAAAQHALPIQHQRSKSSIVEITYIPNQEKAPMALTTKHQRSPEKNMDISSTRPSVISSVGRVSTLGREEEQKKPMQSVQTKLPSFSGQVGLNSEQRANVISYKLDEITAAVNKLSQANALPSYSTATRETNSKAREPPALREDQSSCLNDESNVSGSSSSSYSLNFANISTDRHSSPGSSHQPNTSQPISTRTSSPATKETTCISENSQNSKMTTFSTTPPHSVPNSKTFVQDQHSTSKTFVKDRSMSPTVSANSDAPRPAVSDSTLPKAISEDYEPDFEPDSSDDTRIEDISLPLYETTTETTIENDVSLQLSKDAEQPSDKTYCAEDKAKEVKELAKRVIGQSIERELLPPPPPPPPALPPPPPLSHANSTQTAPGAGISLPANQNTGHLMPDIINELELRRHQLILDSEHLKQYEHVTAVPYMYVREIPNKPPPPYVPPAHGSPMTTIFPSEERIRDITFRRTHELYCELLKTDYCNEKGEKLPLVQEEQITNIYERIILDICREYLEERQEILRDGDPGNFHSQLAFFNPPDRLRCIQDAIYKEVRTCLAMDKTAPKKSQVYSVYGQRAKQDHIGKIIIQEMYDEDDRWCNFHREESEVLQLIVEEMIQKEITGAAREVLLEEGGTIEESREGDGLEIEELDCSESLENAQNEEHSTSHNDASLQCRQDNETSQLDEEPKKAKEASEAARPANLAMS